MLPPDRKACRGTNSEIGNRGRHAEVGGHALFRPPRGDGLEPRSALSGAEGHTPQRPGSRAGDPHGGVMRVLRGLTLRLEPDAIFQLDVPQDKVLVVEAGRTRWL